MLVCFVCLEMSKLINCNFQMLKAYPKNLTVCINCLIYSDTVLDTSVEKQTKRAEPHSDTNEPH